MTSCGKAAPRSLTQIVRGTTAMSGGLKKYVEWMSRGRKIDRVAYVMSQRQLPEPKVGAEWQVDKRLQRGRGTVAGPCLEGCFQVRDRQWFGTSSPRNLEDEAALWSICTEASTVRSAELHFPNQRSAVFSRRACVGLSCSSTASEVPSRICSYGARQATASLS